MWSTKVVERLKNLTVEQVSQYLLFFILAALPLERIPALHPHISGYEVTVRLTQVAGLILILINLPRLWQNRRIWLTSPWKYLAGFLFAAVLSTGLAIALKRALLVTTFIGFDVVLAWTLFEVFDPKKLGLYVKTLIISGIGACLLGIYQFIGDMAGLSHHWTGLLPRYTGAVFGFARIQAASYEPLFFANYLLIPLSLAAALYLWGQNKQRWTVLLMITIIWLTLSRGAYLAIAGTLVLLAIAAVVYRRRASWKRIVVLAAIAVVSVGLAFGAVGLSARLQPILQKNHYNPKTKESVKNFAEHTGDITGGDSFYNRSVTWKTAVTAIKERPLLGIGPGTFGGFAYSQDPHYFKNRDSIVNNELLEILAEHGLIGLILFLAFVASLVWTALKTRLGAAERPVAVALLAALTGVALQYLTFSTLYITHIWVAVALLLAVLATGKKAKSTP